MQWNPTKCKNRKCGSAVASPGSTCDSKEGAEDESNPSENEQQGAPLATEELNNTASNTSRFWSNFRSVECVSLEQNETGGSRPTSIQAEESRTTPIDFTYGCGRREEYHRR